MSPGSRPRPDEARGEAAVAAFARDWLDQHGIRAWPEEAAHGSRWDLGISAIGKIGRIIAALEQFDREVLRKRVHPLVGPASMHCALVQGGAGLSTYAPECRLKVERRTLPGETPEQVVQELEEVVH